MPDPIETLEHLLACRADEIKVERHLRTFWSREEMNDVLIYDIEIIEVERMDEDSVLALIKIFEDGNYDDIFWRLMERCTDECLNGKHLFDDNYIYSIDYECTCVDLIYNYLILAAGRLDIFDPMIPVNEHPRYMDAAIGGGHVEVIKYLLEQGLEQYPGLYEDMIRQVVAANKWECFVYLAATDCNNSNWFSECLQYERADMLKYILKLRYNKHGTPSASQEPSAKWGNEFWLALKQLHDKQT